MADIHGFPERISLPSRDGADYSLAMNRFLFLAVSDGRRNREWSSNQANSLHGSLRPL
jgi:hypothetical protein